ncbi:MAG: hypothetical protein ABEI99_07645, partial [Halobaculum sp.]
SSGQNGARGMSERCVLGALRAPRLASGEAARRERIGWGGKWLSAVPVRFAVSCSAGAVPSRSKMSLA